MDKTSQKITKDPKRVEAAHKGMKNYMNKLKGSILNDAKKKAMEILAMQAMKLEPPTLPLPPPTAPPTLPPLLLTALPTLPPVTLISKSLVYLLSLP